MLVIPIKYTYSFLINKERLMKLKIDTSRLIELSLQEQQKVSIYILNKVDQCCEKNGIEYSLMFGTLLGAVRHKGFIPWDEDIDIAMTRGNYNKFLDCYQDDETYLYSPNHTEFKQSLMIRVKLKNFLSIPFSSNGTGDLNTYIDIFIFDKVSLAALHGSNIWAKAHRYAFYQRVLECPYSARNKIRLVGKWLLSLPLRCFPKDHFGKKQYHLLAKTLSNSDEYNYIIFNAFMRKPEETRDSTLLSKEDIEAPTIRLRFGARDYHVFACFDKILRQSYGDYMTLPPAELRKIRHRFYRLPEANISSILKS